MITRKIEGVQYKLIKEGFEPIYLFNPEVDCVLDMISVGYNVVSKLTGKFKVSQTEKEFCNYGKISFIEGEENNYE